jgi:hypothetical protein
LFVECKAVVRYRNRRVCELTWLSPAWSLTGIVIDAFGALKEEKEADEEDLKTICFVCNVDRFTADQNGIGFDKHVKLEHNPKYYLFFLIYLQRKSRSSMTGQERYVYDKVWPAGGQKSFDARWLPREETFTIHKGQDVDETLTEVQDLSAALLKLSARVDANHASLAEGEGLSAMHCRCCVRGGSVRRADQHCCDATRCVA